jgi:protein SCO1/2
MITAGWWALALWPAGAIEPEWLSRTRAACFGSEPGGLPDVRGWIVLIGEPAGMVGLLVAIWGQSLRADLRRLREDSLWRVLGGGFAAVTVVGFVALGVRVTRAFALGNAPISRATGLRTGLDLATPRVELTDQHGRRVSFGDYRGRPALVTFAFGHCTTVCPTIVREVAAARRRATRQDVRLVVVTLDPWRDTPDRLPSLAARWELARDDRVLSGAVAEVEAALDALGIGRGRNETTGDIEHGGTVLLLDERGKISWRMDGDWQRVEELLARR